MIKRECRWKLLKVVLTLYIVYACREDGILRTEYPAKRCI